MRLIASTAPRAAPHDRNPATKMSEGGALVSENAAKTTKWTYTVPTGKKALLGVVVLDILATVAATSVVSTDTIDALVEVTPSGGIATNAFLVRLHTDSYAAGDRAHDSFAGAAALQPGDVVTASHTFTGSAAGAGRALVVASGLFTEFDA